MREEQACIVMQRKGSDTDGHDDDAAADAAAAADITAADDKAEVEAAGMDHR
jgi:hypothetical protein